MLALLPQILFLGTFAATLIRVTAAFMLAYSSWRRMSAPSLFHKGFAAVETAVSIALFVGAWTQVAALLAVVLIAASLFSPTLRVWPRSTLALLLVMAATLVVTGPGAFAFDLPL